MSLIFIKIKNLLEEMTGIDMPVLEAAAHKGGMLFGINSFIFYFSSKM